MLDDPNPVFMRKAIQLAVRNVARGGGPFGAVIVKDETIVATGANRVTGSHDPTAHAEVVAIRRACRKLKTFELTGCDLYTSCEPCPMCFGAIYWTRLLRTFYAASANDAADAGFDDRRIYHEIRKDCDGVSWRFKHISVPETRQPFEAWKAKENKVRY
jgi:tRNA(Arg) A34 adenosine deaminase TadA